MIFAMPTAGNPFAAQLPSDKIRAEHPACFNGTASEPEYIACAQKFLNIAAYNDMREVLGHLLQRFPNSTDGWNALGVLEHQCAHFEEAATALRKSLSFNPQNDKTKNNLKASMLALANQLREAKKYEEAVKVYTEISQNHPEDIYVQHNIGTIQHMQLSRYDEAIKTFKKIIRTQPQEAHTWLSLANCYLDMHDKENMAQLARKSKPHKVAHDAVTTLEAVLEFQTNATFTMPHIDALPLLQPEAIKAFTANNIFREFVEKLSKFKQANMPLYRLEETLPPCHFMGDSHILSAAHLPLTLAGKTYRATPYLHGGKLFNLTQPYRYRSQYLLEDWSNKVDKNAPLIISYGEIDCRAEGGYLSYFEEHPETDPDAFMRAHIQSYMALVKKVCPQKEIYISSTPPLSPTNAAKSPQLVTVIALFNNILKEEVCNAGFGYINLFDNLITPENAGEEGAHIDRIHLTPKAYKKALEAQ